MQTNGITIPDESRAIEHIADPVGGWLYTVTTTVTVVPSRLDEVQRKVANLQADIAEKTAELEALQTNVALFPDK